MSSSRVSRGAPRSAAPAPAPTLWALEELAGPLAHSPFVAGQETPVIDVDAVAREAYERGYQDGQLAGVSSEAARLRAALSAIDDALLALQGEAETWVSNARENVCAIAVAVARQIVGRELLADPSTVAELARLALSEVPVDQAVVVRVNPADLAVLNALPDDPSNPALHRAEVQWVADPRIAQGGCLLEGRDRIIDGRIDTALERLYRRLSDTDA